MSAATSTAAVETLREAIAAELARHADAITEAPATRFGLVVRALVDRAAAGDVTAICEVFNRTVGAPAQALQIEAGLSKDFPLVQLSWKK